VRVLLLHLACVFILFLSYASSQWFNLDLDEPVLHVCVVIVPLSLVYGLCSCLLRSVAFGRRVFSLLLCGTVAYVTWCAWYCNTNEIAYNFGPLPYLIDFPFLVLIPWLIGSMVGYLCFDRGGIWSAPRIKKPNDD